MLHISNNVSIPDDEIEISAQRAQGPGGQNVNKVSSAVQLRLNVRDCSLPEFYKERLLSLRDHRLTAGGIILIKAQQHRTQEQNRADALARLQELVRRAGVVPRKRKPSRPSRGAKARRLDAKKRRGWVKALRARVTD